MLGYLSYNLKLVELILVGTISYLAGSILFGELIARSKGINLREVGSGNVGATNVGRALGKKYALLVFILDMTKGFLPTLIAGLLTGWGSWGVAVAGVSSVLGHMFSAFARLKGGKGVATAFGVVLAVSWIPALMLVALWILTLLLTRYVSVASILSSICAVPLFLILGYPKPLMLMALVIAGLITYKHRSNIGRLLRGEEPKALG